MHLANAIIKATYHRCIDPHAQWQRGWVAAEDSWICLEGTVRGCVRDPHKERRGWRRRR